MYADRVNIFHVADGNAVVISVAHDFIFDLFPSRNAAFDENLTDHGVVQAFDDDFNEFFLVLGDTAARSAHRVSRTDNDRITDGVRKRNS